jgi:shikimate 5-dehydrogenase
MDFSRGERVDNDARQIIVAAIAGRGGAVNVAAFQLREDIIDDVRITAETFAHAEDHAFDDGGQRHDGGHEQRPHNRTAFEE